MTGMKKWLFAMVVMAMMVAAPVKAQIHLGVRGGLNNTKLSVDMKDIKTDSRYGWFIGPTVKLDLPMILGVDISALYNQRKFEVMDETFTQKTIEFPVNLRLLLKMVEGTGLFFTAGPQFGFNIGDDEFEWTHSSSYKNTFQLKKSLFSFNLGAGLMVADLLELAFVYNIGLGKTGELKNLTEKDKPTTKAWMLSAAVFF